MSFIRAVTNVSIAVFLVCPGTLVATFVIINMINNNNWGAAAALTTMLLLITVAAVGIAGAAFRRTVRSMPMA